MWMIKGKSGLFKACADANEIETVRDLAPHYADAKDDDTGSTALMFASEHQNGEAVEILLAAGSLVNLVDHEDQTALQKAVARPIGATDTWQPEVAAQIVKALIAGGADVPAAHRAHGAFGKCEPALAIAAATTRSALVVQALLDGGADPNQSIPDGEAGCVTALYCALDTRMAPTNVAQGPDKEVVQTLLAGGADPLNVGVERRGGPLDALVLAQRRANGVGGPGCLESAAASWQQVTTLLEQAVADATAAKKEAMRLRNLGLSTSPAGSFNFGRAGADTMSAHALVDRLTSAAAGRYEHKLAAEQLRKLAMSGDSFRDELLDANAADALIAVLVSPAASAFARANAAGAIGWLARGHAGHLWHFRVGGRRGGGGVDAL